MIVDYRFVEVEMGVTGEILAGFNIRIYEKDIERLKT